MSYARFATAPIGAGLTVLEGGLVVTTTVNAGNYSRTVRSDIAHSAGVHGVEFVAWGDDAAGLVAIGVLQPSVDLSQQLGVSAQSIGWQLPNGSVTVGGVIVATPPVAAKGDTAGLRVDLDADTIAFYLNGALVHTRALPQAGATWHFGVSMGSAVAGEIACAVNAGQWIPRSAAAAAGWESAPPAAIDLRLSDYEWLSAPDDDVPNARYEGLIDPAGIETYAAMHHWAWEGEPPTQGGNAQVTLLDADGQLDALAAGDVRGLQVAVHTAERDYAWARFVSPDTSVTLNLYQVDKRNRVRFIGANGREVVKELPATNAQTIVDVAADGLTAPVTVVFDQQPDSRYFFVHSNTMTGSLPPFAASNKLTHVYCYLNELAGDVPDFALVPSFQVLYGYNNKFTGWAGSTVSAAVARIRLQNNLLTQAAVDALLAACVANGRTSAAGACDLFLNGTGNAAPSPAGYANRDTLLARGWDVRVN